MKELLWKLIGAITAGIIIMVIHELPKSVVFNFRSSKESKIEKRQIYKLQQYIDPIGLLFCVTSYAGFSKPYMYRIRDKKTNLYLGVTGFSVLVILHICSLLTMEMLYSGVEQASRGGFLYHLLSQMVFNSAGMLVVNLFPVSTFDMGLIIAGWSPSKYLSIVKNDHTIKLILLLAIIMGVVQILGRMLQVGVAILLWKVGI